MKNKKGISMVILAVTIIVLIILAGALVASVSSTVNFSKMTAWTNEMNYIQEVVDERLNGSSFLDNDILLADVSIDISSLSTEQKGLQFEGETITNNIVNLKELDLGKLKITNTVYGNKREENDIYAISPDTGRVYYVLGFEVDNEIYYTVTNSLLDSKGLQINSNLNTVIFKPSNVNYTNKPIIVTVKMPASFNASITTTNNNIIISGPVSQNNIKSYMINETNPQTGNYEITVEYTNNSKSYTSVYEVKNFNSESPVISDISISNYKYDANNNMYLVNLTAQSNNKIKIFKYTQGIIADSDAKEYFETNGKNIVDGKINISKGNYTYTIYAEDYAGNYALKTETKWIESIVDGVPIPKGFVASGVTGENKKADGLVIYEGKDPVTDSNISLALTSRNQYVWIPVEDMSKFVRQNFGENRTITDTIGDSEGYWEVIPSSTVNSSYITSTTINEVKEMYKSVEKYKGFYVARYEAGSTTATTTELLSQMAKYPIHGIKWGNSMSDDTGGVVALSRNVYPKTNNKFGVISTLTYGVQWDTILNLWKTDKNITVYKNNANGNYTDHKIEQGDLNIGASYSTDNGSSWNQVTYTGNQSTFTKNTTDAVLLTTGALKAGKITNVYDMSGNLAEYTMEGGKTTMRTARGGYYAGLGVTRSFSFRSGLTTPTNTYWAGFRISLYLK